MYYRSRITQSTPQKKTRLIDTPPRIQKGDDKKNFILRFCISLYFSGFVAERIFTKNQLVLYSHNIFWENK